MDRTDDLDLLRVDHDEVELDGDICSPIIGQDTFISEPYHCTKKCYCKRLSPTCSNLPNSSDASPSGSPQHHLVTDQRSSHGSVDTVWDTYVDPVFVEHDFPLLPTQSVSMEDVVFNASSSTNGNHFIKEVLINSHHSLEPNIVEAKPPKSVEPRQKFQRFREKRFICDECNRSFTMKQNVQQHFFQYHNPSGLRKTPVRVVAKRFQCTKCRRMFKTLEKAQKHEARLHGEKSTANVFACQHCAKIFNAQNQLKEHIDVVHQSLRPHKCEQCGIEFGRVGGLRRHNIMVHQQKTHLCPYEGCKHPGFKCTKALTAHIRSVHTQDRPFSCLFCQRTFVRKNDLKVHELTHSVHCELQCRKCNTPFRRLIYLQKHEKRCTGEPSELRQRGLRKSLSKNTPQLSNLCDSDECMTTKSSEFDDDEQLLPTEFLSVTEDESLEENQLYPNTDRHSEICQRSGTVEEESELTKHAPMEEGEIYESQTEPREHSPIKPAQENMVDRTLMDNAGRQVDHDIGSSVMNEPVQAKSLHEIRENNYENGEIQEAATLPNDKKSPFDNNVKSTQEVIEESQQSKPMPRRSTKFDPREEAVAVAKRPRCSMVRMSTSSIKEYLNKSKLRNTKTS